jgi:hypothetical protein
LARQTPTAMIMQFCDALHQAPAALLARNLRPGRTDCRYVPCECSLLLIPAETDLKRETHRDEGKDLCQQVVQTALFQQQQRWLADASSLGMLHLSICNGITLIVLWASTVMGCFTKVCRKIIYLKIILILC